LAQVQIVVPGSFVLTSPIPVKSNLAA